MGHCAMCLAKTEAGNAISIDNLISPSLQATNTPNLQQKQTNHKSNPTSVHKDKPKQLENEIEKKITSYITNSTKEKTIESLSCVASPVQWPSFISHTNCQVSKHTLVHARKKISQSTIARHSTFLNRTWINIFVYGTKNVGKSAFAKRIINDTYSDEYNTSTQEEILTSKTLVNSRSYDIKISIPISVDLTTLYDSKDFLIGIYDVSNYDSYKYLIDLYEDLTSKHWYHHQSQISASMIMIGNKTDLPEVVNPEEPEKFCKDHSCHFFRISVKESRGVKEIFNTILNLFDKDVFQYLNEK